MSEEIPVLPTSESFWRDHVKRAQAFKGSDLEYCRLNNLKSSTFGGHKSKFGFSKKSKPRKNSSTPVFKKVEVKATTIVKPLLSKKPLDPKSPEWAARFLKEFLN